MVPAKIRYLHNPARGVLFIPALHGNHPKRKTQGLSSDQICKKNIPDQM
jgi:hypothetical protein